MLNFSKLINSTFASKFPIYIITSNGAYIDGIYQKDVLVRTKIAGSCQTLSGNDLKLLPENLRSEASRQLFTTVEVKENTDVEYRDIKYKVILSEEYDDLGSHWKCVMKRYSNGYNSPEKTPTPMIENGHYEDGVWIDE